MRLDWTSIEAELTKLLGGLEGLSLDRARLEGFAEEIAAGRLGPASNLLAEEPQLSGLEVIERIDALPEAERARMREAGREALARGEIAVAVLNGGMATRFGGRVKGLAEAVGGRSFLEIKLAQARAQGPVPFLIMNSFATHQATLAFLAAQGLRERVRPLLQSVSLRLTPMGELFREASGSISPYAPGHGDFLEVIKTSGQLAELRASGVRSVLLSNVDNLGAELDPLVVGYHLLRERPLTVELAETKGGDVGGTVARVQGKVRVVEGLCFPPGFNFERVRFINTNTFVISLDALAPDHPLSWLYVEKTADGRAAVQMERLIGELSAFVSSGYLASPRDGAQGRFFPVKTPEDLERLRRDPVLRTRFGSP